METGSPAELTGVGVGPGDPGQLTLAALDRLQAADRVVAPSLSPEAVGRAESVVRAACPDVQVERVVVPMDPSTTSPYEDAARSICSWLDQGERVAFATIGDPNVYSTFTALAAEVLRRRPETSIATVPGIMAFQVLASSTNSTVVSGTQSMALLTALDGLDELSVALSDHRRAVVVYKGGRNFPEIAKLAARTGRLSGAIAGELLGLPGERLAPLGDIADSPSAYLSTIIFPATTQAADAKEPPP